VLCRAGRWDEAESLLLDVLGPAGSRGSGHRAAASAHLAALRVEQGRLEEAAQLLEPYLDQLCTCLPLARLHLARGEPDLAIAAARRGLRRLRGDALRAASLHSVLVEAELLAGDVEAARRSADDLQALADRAESSELAADAALARARVQAACGNHAEAVGSLEAALTCLDNDDRPALRGTVDLLLAASYEALGRRADALVEARAARSVFERLGSSTGVDRAAAQLRTLGAPSRSKSSSAIAATTLTARELEVLELVSKGLTNAEIAARLYISPKTAEHHVSRVLDKLGVRNRAEAAARAGVLGTTE
jgi:DNA-binding NarL/FixJ family response regulator